ncbi:MAG: YhjD/YihY/BrkB family envelope integrity protein [Mycobacterium sp.]
MLGWLDRLQQRSPTAGFAIAVVYKFIDDQAGYLAALVAYYAFVSLFPLLMLLTTVLSVVLAGRPEWRAAIYDSALAQFPLIGDQLSEPSALSGGTAGVVIGVSVALYGGLGVGQAVQNAMETVWAVPRHLRPDPFRSRLRSLVLLLVMGTALVTTTLLVAMGRGFGAAGTVGVVVAAFALNAAVCTVAFRVTTTRPLTYAEVLPGAVTAAAVWQLLQWFGAGYVARVVATASVINSVFAVVLGMIAFLYLVSTSLLICAEINVVRVDRLHPRALLTPFTDDVDLTAADRKMYEGQAQAQRAKPFQRVEVTFDSPGGVGGDRCDPSPGTGGTDPGGDDEHNPEHRGRAGDLV